MNLFKKRRALTVIFVMNGALPTHIRGDSFTTTVSLARTLQQDAYRAYAQQRYADAAAVYEQLVTLDPRDSKIRCLLGVCYACIGSFEQALTAFDKALECNPWCEKAYIGKVQLSIRRGDISSALNIVQQALSYLPDSVNLYWLLVKLYKESDLLQEAARAMRRILELEPYNCKAMVELANILNAFDDALPECAALYRAALVQKPHLVSAQYNLAYTLKKMGAWHESLQLYEHVVKLCPDYPQAVYGRGVTYLALGDFERGWPGYEWRWRANGSVPKQFDRPLWDGSSLVGKRILVYAEQGLGDTLQFVRYLDVLKSKGAYVIFMPQKALLPLIRECYACVDCIVHANDPLPSFDVYIPLMSLPLLCGTRLETIPRNVPYLQVPQQLVHYWNERLKGDTKIRVGLCWQGNANYSTPFLRQAVAAKSMNINAFAPLAHVPDVSFYSLQKVFGEEQLHTVQAGFSVKEFGPDFDENRGSFMDTAAVMKNLDLVISVDTATCHLAGALGVPVWVPLPAVADWRWMIGREDTPWYPTMKLYRQKTPGVWGEVIERIVQDLAAYCANRE